MKNNIQTIFCFFFLIASCNNVQSAKKIIISNKVIDSTTLNFSDTLINEIHKFVIKTDLKCINKLSLDSVSNKLKIKGGGRWYFANQCALSSITQTVKFISNDRLVNVISNNTVYDSLSKKIENCCSELHGAIESVFLLNGKVNDLYLLNIICEDGEIWALYSMDGNLLWFKFLTQADSKEYGNYKLKLEESGIKQEEFDNCELLDSSKILDIF